MSVGTKPLPEPMLIDVLTIKPRLHYTRRDMKRHSSIVHTMRDIVARRHVAAGDLGSGANKIR